MKNNAVIFDLDDTLFPESSYVRSGFLAVAQWGQTELRIPQTDSVNHLNEVFESGVRGNAFDLWLEHFGLNTSPELIQQIVDVYRSHQPKIAPFEEVPSILGNLSKTYYLGLVSDGFLDVQKKKFAALQLDDFFDVICFSDQLGREFWKPSPRPFQLVAEQLKIPASNCIYVGDNPTKDFLGAHNAGMRSVRIRLHGGQYASLEPSSTNSRAHVEVTSHEDLETVLEELFSDWNATSHVRDT